MRWLKDNWLAALVALGIIFSIWLVRHDAAVRADADRKATIVQQRVGCQRAGVQKALSAAGWLSASAARRADGNEAKANYYEGIADGTILTIPAPPGREGSRALVQVESKFIEGRKRYVLSPAARDLQAAGCRIAYS